MGRSIKEVLLEQGWVPVALGDKITPQCVDLFSGAPIQPGPSWCGPLASVSFCDRFLRPLSEEAFISGAQALHQELGIQLDTTALTRHISTLLKLGFSLGVPFPAEQLKKSFLYRGAALLPPVRALDSVAYTQAVDALGHLAAPGGYETEIFRLLTKIKFPNNDEPESNERRDARNLVVRLLGSSWSRQAPGAGEKANQLTIDWSFVPTRVSTRAGTPALSDTFTCSDPLHYEATLKKLGVDLPAKRDESTPDQHHRLLALNARLIARGWKYVDAGDVLTPQCVEVGHTQNFVIHPALLGKTVAEGQTSFLEPTSVEAFKDGVELLSKEGVHLDTSETAEVIGGLLELGFGLQRQDPEGSLPSLTYLDFTLVAPTQPMPAQAYRAALALLSRLGKDRPLSERAALVRLISQLQTETNEMKLDTSEAILDLLGPSWRVQLPGSPRQHWAPLYFRPQHSTPFSMDDPIPVSGAVMFVCSDNATYLETLKALGVRMTPPEVAGPISTFLASSAYKVSTTPRIVSPRTLLVKGDKAFHSPVATWGVTTVESTIRYVLDAPANSANSWLDQELLVADALYQAGWKHAYESSVDGVEFVFLYRGSSHIVRLPVDASPELIKDSISIIERFGIYTISTSKALVLVRARLQALQAAQVKSVLNATTVSKQRDALQTPRIVLKDDAEFADTRSTAPASISQTTSAPLDKEATVETTTPAQGAENMSGTTTILEIGGLTFTTTQVVKLFTNKLARYLIESGRPDMAETILSEQARTAGNLLVPLTLYGAANYLAADEKSPFQAYAKRALEPLRAAIGGNLGAVANLVVAKMDLFGTEESTATLLADIAAAKKATEAKLVEETTARVRTAEAAKTM